MPRLPDREAWAVFAKAETGSFAQATADLALSMATISRAIGRLEARIGASLLNHTSRRLAPTDTVRHRPARAAAVIALPAGRLSVAPWAEGLGSEPN